MTHHASSTYMSASHQLCAYAHQSMQCQCTDAGSHAPACMHVQGAKNTSRAKRPRPSLPIFKSALHVTEYFSTSSRRSVDCAVHERVKNNRSGNSVKTINGFATKNSGEEAISRCSARTDSTAPLYLRRPLRIRSHWRAPSVSSHSASILLRRRTRGSRQKTANKKKKIKK